MPYDKGKHHRRSIRLPGYDYASAGAYFVTICVHGGECLLGEVVDGEMRLNDWGQIAHAEWLASEEIRRELKLDAFVVMPNHVHGIVWITASDDTPAYGDPIGAHGDPVGAHGDPVGAHGDPVGAHSDLVGAHGDSVGAHGDSVGAHGDSVGAHGDSVGAHGRAPLRAPLRRPPKSLGSFVAGYKSVVTKQINRLRDMPGVPFWQRNYWEHVIRNEGALERIREYIDNNPARWAEDQLHPDAPPNRFNRWQPSSESDRSA